MTTMTTYELGELARRMKTRVNRGTAAFHVAVGVNVLALIARLFWATPVILPWTRALLFTSLLMMFYFRSYYAAKNEMLLSILPRSTTGLEFYRAQLLRRLDYLRNDYMFVLVSGSLAVFTIFNAIQIPALAIPTAIAVIGFVTLEYYRRRRELPRLQRELAALQFYQREHN